MQPKLVDLLSSPAWWISVVVVGVVINICSSYFKTWTDNLLSRFSSRRKNKIESERKAVAQQIVCLRANQHLQLVKMHSENRMRISAIMYLAMATTMATIAVFSQSLRYGRVISIIPLCLATLYVFIAMRRFFAAVKESRILHAAWSTGCNCPPNIKCDYRDPVPNPSFNSDATSTGSSLPPIS